MISWSGIVDLRPIWGGFARPTYGGASGGLMLDTGETAAPGYPPCNTLQSVAGRLRESDEERPWSLYSAEQTKCTRKPNTWTPAKHLYSRQLVSRIYLSVAAFTNRRAYLPDQRGQLQVYISQIPSTCCGRRRLHGRADGVVNSRYGRLSRSLLVISGDGS